MKYLNTKEEAEEYIKSRRIYRSDTEDDEPRFRWIGDIYEQPDGGHWEIFIQSATAEGGEWVRYDPLE